LAASWRAPPTRHPRGDHGVVMVASSSSSSNGLSGLVASSFV
jgi:hypothetical protein